MLCCHSECMAISSGYWSLTLVPPWISPSIAGHDGQVFPALSICSMGWLARKMDVERACTICTCTYRGPCHHNATYEIMNFYSSYIRHSSIRYY